MLSHLFDRIYKAEISPGRVARIFRDYDDRLRFGTYNTRCQAASSDEKWPDHANVLPSSMVR